MSGNDELSHNARLLIENKNNRIFLSIASLGEISIKSSIGKLTINSSFNSIIDDIINNQIGIISIEFKHLIVNHDLFNYHKDPFDRIILSQAISENLEIISRDNVFDEYLNSESINRIW